MAARRVITRVSVLVCGLLLAVVAVVDAAEPRRLPAYGLSIAAPAVVGIVAGLIYLRQGKAAPVRRR
jgi:hypothetical protein